MASYDIRHALPLTPEEAVPATDLIAVWHGTAVGNAERSMSLADFFTVAGGEGAAPAGGVSKAEFDALKASVITDLNNLRDTIMLLQSSLDADAGVATDTFVADGTPPALTTE